jgi:hypothetical protein
MNKILFGITFLCISLPVYGQNSDGFLRINPTFSYKLNKKWKTEFDYRLTMDQNMSKFRSSHFQFATSYKIFKPVTVELAYRYTVTPIWNPHRFMISAIYKHKFEHFDLSSRTRYQFSTEFFDPYFMNQVREPRIYLRQKFGIDYAIPNTKLNVFASGEIFFRFRYEGVEFHRMRYQVGIEKELKFGNSVGLRIIYEDRTAPTRQDRMIITAKYDLSIDTMVKKIKKKKEKKAKEKANNEVETSN